jgi:hypothetical protein
MPTIRRVADETVLDWVEVDVIEMNGKVPVIADRMLPIARCQMPRRSPRRVITSERGSTAGNDFAKVIFTARQRPEKSASPCGKVHRQCMWSGRTTQASISNGAPARTRRTAARSASMCLTNKFERRSNRFTVKKKVPPGTRLRRWSGMHRVCPTLVDGGMRSRFSALRCLIEWEQA